MVVFALVMVVVVVIPAVVVLRRVVQLIFDVSFNEGRKCFI